MVRLNLKMHKLFLCFLRNGVKIGIPSPLSSYFEERSEVYMVPKSYVCVTVSRKSLGGIRGNPTSMILFYLYYSFLVAISFLPHFLANVMPPL